ncbi:MAG: PD40 domain-containing protein [Armatimonadetes bacterium]|nr:PD40 domain-containing protein [Armatimonadota bacterium]
MLTTILTLIAFNSIVQDPVDAWEKRLTNNKAYDGSPVFSRDGSKIAFVSNRDGSNEIYVMNADGTAQTRLTENEDYDGSPAFSPDGSKIAFESGRDGNWEVYVMNADGSAQTRLTDSEDYDGSPAFSPDSSKIAFVSRRDGNNEVYVMNADGTGQTRLTDNAVFDGAPTFSPDGTKIAYVSLYGGSYVLYDMNADGTTAKPLTPDRPILDVPTFSSNWSKIAYASSAETSWRDLEIYIMNADGSGVTRLRDHQAEDSNPALSLDGSMIVFQTDRDGNDEIYLMNAIQEAWTIDHVAKAVVSTEKQVYAVGEDITFGLRILNTSRGSFSIDSSLVRTWNFTLGVYDSDGNFVKYEGWNRTLHRAPADSPSDFVMLDSGQYFGVSRAFSIRLRKPGTYRIEVTVMQGRHAEEAEKFGILGYFDWKVKAEPIYITVSASAKQ